jgi:hypothetical protein
VRKKVRWDFLSSVLWSATWVDTITIDVCLSERLKSSDHSIGASISPRNQLKALFHKNGHYTSKMIRDLIEENALSLRHLELSYLPTTLPNLRTYTHNGANLEFGIFNGVKLEYGPPLHQMFPYLVNLKLPRGACSFWTIHKRTGEIQEARNVEFYNHIQQNRLREKSAVYTYWFLKYVYRFNKDVTKIIAHMVIGLPNSHWIVSDQNNELLHPPDEAKYAIYKEKPEIFSLLEHSNRDINSMDTHLKKIKNQISNLKKKRDRYEEDIEGSRTAQKRLATRLFSNKKK